MLARDAGSGPTSGLVDQAPSIPDREHRLPENRAPVGQPARTDRRSARRARDPSAHAPPTIQQQLTGPAESLRALGLLIARLQQSSVQVPASVEKVVQVPEPSEAEVSQAASDVVELARAVGNEESADFLGRANRGLFQAKTSQEAWSTDELAEEIAKLVSARTPSRTTNNIDALVIALFFYLLQLFGPAAVQAPPAERVPAPPPLVVPEAQSEPIIDVDVEVNVTLEKGGKRAAPHGARSKKGAPKRGGPSDGE